MGVFRDHAYLGETFEMQAVISRALDSDIVYSILMHLAGVIAGGTILDRLSILGFWGVRIIVIGVTPVANRWVI